MQKLLSEIFPCLNSTIREEPGLSYAMLRCSRVGLNQMLILLKYGRNYAGWTKNKRRKVFEYGLFRLCALGVCVLLLDRDCLKAALLVPCFVWRIVFVHKFPLIRHMISNNPIYSYTLHGTRLNGLIGCSVGVPKAQTLA